jgi:hypothetical protein
VYVQRFWGVRLGDGLNRAGWCLHRGTLPHGSRRVEEGTRGAVIGALCLRFVTGWGWVGGLGVLLHVRYLCDALGGGYGLGGYRRRTHGPSHRYSRCCLFGLVICIV